MSALSRSDVLKLASSVLTGALISRLAPSLKHYDDNKRSNIIIIVMDALSARNLSLYGYPRHTTPQLEKFANRSTVYHAHYSAGDFTPSGTASMLTGLLPWKHRAVNHGGLIKENLASNNPFAFLGKDYLRLGFAQNPWADRLLSQFGQDLDFFLPSTSFSLRSDDPMLARFTKDRAVASFAIEDFMFTGYKRMSGSPFMGYVYRTAAWRNLVLQNNSASRYPMGIPNVEDYLIPYLNEDTYKGVLAEILNLESTQKPYFSYFHLFSPHWPYRPRRDFTKLFHDKFIPPAKPTHPLGTHLSEQYLLRRRTWYDQQIAQVDAEFGNLINELDRKGVLDHSYIFVTSDHGEMFERGVIGHGQEMMYEPVIKIPLLIHVPGQNTRADIHAMTLNTDLVPTLLAISGKSPPTGLDGQVLPQFGGIADHSRPLFSIYAVDNSASLPLTKTVISMRLAEYKLVAYFGYGKFNNVYELYNIEEDPEELQDLSGADISSFGRLKEQLLDSLADANRPFERH